MFSLNYTVLSFHQPRKEITKYSLWMTIPLVSTLCRTQGHRFAQSSINYNSSWELKCKQKLLSIWDKHVFSIRYKVTESACKVFFSNNMNKTFPLLIFVYRHKAWTLGIITINNTYSFKVLLIKSPKCSSRLFYKQLRCKKQMFGPNSPTKKWSKESCHVKSSSKTFQ